MSETRKYEFTGKQFTLGNVTLHQIRALRNIPRHDIKAGDIGGYIESEYNLDHGGDCWVGDDAKVYNNARIAADACVDNRAYVYDNAYVGDRALVTDEAEVYDNAEISGDAVISGRAEIYGNAKIFGAAKVTDAAEVYGNAMVADAAIVCDDAEVCDNAEIHSKIKVCEFTKIAANTKLYGVALINYDIITDRFLYFSPDGPDGGYAEKPQESENKSPAFGDRLAELNKYAKELDVLKRENMTLKKLLEDSLVYLRKKEIDEDFAKMRDKLERCCKILSE